MSSFVYNDGNFEIEKPEEIFLTLGMFFDGTKNNMYHTEIRKKIQKKGEFKETKNSEITQDEWDIYAKYAHKNESFGNDFTNVARKYYACEEEYRIYIEGIGTANPKDKNKSDRNDGYVYGRGVTGVVEKVRLGCAKLAKKISDKIKEKKKNNKDNEVTKISLKIDAYGFSRGAAAARFFLYQLQKEAYPFLWHNYPYDYERTTLYKGDEVGNFIEDSWLKEGLLPPFGLLGTELLKADVPRELIETMFVKVRFLGIYDTVASYDRDCIAIPDFEGQIGKLHLHEIGNPQRAVHYTAMDEHREYFSLTRLKTKGFKNRVERNFPGVHSDVGGSYNHDPFTIRQFRDKDQKAKLFLANPYIPGKTSEYEMLYLDDSFFFSHLKSFRKELLEEGWYRDRQIKIGVRKISYIFPSIHREYIYGERTLCRGYSFIPLHFMCEEACKYLTNNELSINKILNDYALEDTFLEYVKEYLREHTIENDNDDENKWVLQDRSAFETEESYTINDNVLFEKREEKASLEEENAIDGGELEEVEVTAIRGDYLLRKLRNNYLHRSSRVNTLEDRLGHHAAKDRKRHEF